MASLPSYSRQFAIAAKKVPAADQSKRPAPSRSRDVSLNGPKASHKSQKTLVDAFKQHGMRLCDGARLNAVGKGIYVLGRVPPSVCASVTALYLSQNNLQTLDGVDQFAAVRLLSVGGNLLASDDEVMKLDQLAQLRNLNLMGNPLCDQPNYRLRIVAMLKNLQVLDNIDITKKERVAAKDVAAQDDALRAMVTQNHFDIQKLQRISNLISMHKEFYGRVMAGVATGRFDRVPSPNDVACNVSMLLRLWRYEKTLSESEQQALQVQMLAIIIRTHSKLADHPKVKAKEFLIKLANGSSPRAQRVPDDINQRCASWEEAYGNVIALQQKTIVNLYALCEKNRKEMVEFLKELLSMDPRQRNRLVGDPFELKAVGRSETKRPPPSNQTRSRKWEDSFIIEEKQGLNESGELRSSHHQLPPQQQDPETWDRQELHSIFLPPHPSTLTEKRLLDKTRKVQTSETRFTRPQQTQTRDRKVDLRSGEFANKSLGEAIHTFKLRDSSPAFKLTGATRMPSKIPQLHTIYTVQQNESPISLDLKHPLVYGRQSTEPLAPEYRKNSRENKNCIDSEVATEMNDEQRRVSSNFTREDLDMTSISAISHASSSPQHTRRVHEEIYVPVAKTRSNPLDEVATQRSQPPHEINQASINENRLQELEQREEKYIRALMQSEQRELDLRNNLSQIQRKLTSSQRTLTQQLHEREAVKEEMTQRTLAVAAPKILKRFFIKWIHFYNWSQQMKHLQKKRCFILQHDQFWVWRRKVWIQQELRQCQKKYQLGTRKLHFNEWVNFTRVNIIAKRAKMLRKSRFLKTVFRSWIATISRLKCAKKLQQKQQNVMVYRTQSMCFREWKRRTRHKNALKKIHDLRWQDSIRDSKQTAFSSWKLFLYAVARPLQERSTHFRYQIQCKQTRLHFREWRKLHEIDKLHNFRLRRRVWTRWVKWRRRMESEKFAVRNENIAIAKVHFIAWHVTAAEEATSRRSLNLAKRYLNRRRLRKLWVHWKYFSMAKRKYTQDSTKALKHYFIKLLRASWGLWKQRTHVNLQQVKTKKYGTLQRHFDAFRAGIRLVKAQKARARMLNHAETRQKWSLLRRFVGFWRGFTLRKKRCMQNGQFVASQRRQSTIKGVWRLWSSLHVKKLQNQLKILQKSYDNSVHEKHELEAHLQAAKDTAVSLSDEMEILHEQSKGEDKQVVDLEQRLRLCQERNFSLQSELKSAKMAIERERHAWEEALCDEEEKRDSDSKKYRSLAQDNQVLQVQVIELKRELEAEKAKLVEAERVNEDLRFNSEKTSEIHHTEVAGSVAKQKEFEKEIIQLRGQLKEQETEREDTANRLQEYEKRIASTCEAMNEHEQAHERENERLSSECTSFEAKWKEEQVKNVELNHLLQEKNHMILTMTQRRNLEYTQSNHEETLRGPIHCTGDINHSCSRHSPLISSQLTDSDQFTTQSSKKSFGRSSRRSNLAFPLGSVERYKKSDEFESLTDGNSIAEEILIDKHTSKVHEDIRMLQERISKRLEQTPAYTQLPTRRSRFPVKVLSPISSNSSLSDSETTEETQLIEDRVRRARLRRIQTQKQAMILAVSPAVTRLAFQAKDRENVASSANLKKKSARKKTILSKIPEKKLTRKQIGIGGHAGRVL